MKKIKQEAKHPNDVPVIFLTDATGKVVRKISINEWRALKANPDQIEELDIKLYREAISFYLQEDYAKAKDLLHFLINKSEAAIFLVFPSGPIKRASVGFSLRRLVISLRLCPSAYSSKK